MQRLGVEDASKSVQTELDAWIETLITLWKFSLEWREYGWDEKASKRIWENDW